MTRRPSEIMAAVVMMGFVVVAGGYAVERYIVPHPLTAALEAWPVQCVSQADPTTCTRLGPNATTFTPQQLIEMQMTFSQPTDTQTIVIAGDGADGSHGTFPIAPLSAVTREPFLIMKGCDMGSTQTRADDIFTIRALDAVIGRGTVTIQSTDGRSSRAC